MRHNREEVIKRTIQEFDLLDHLVAHLTDEEWNRLLPRPETKDPWTIKDALAHITHWKADVARSAKKQHKPIEERGLNVNEGNHLVYLRWHERSPQDVLAWHRQVHLEEVMTAEDQKVAGMDIHAGALETGWMLAFHPNLVDPAYKQAVTKSGETTEDVIRMAGAPNWPGYVGAPALAKASYGTALAEKISANVIALALSILDGENVDAAACSDRTPLQDMGWAGRKQQEWLQKNGLR
jgi:hypothetical protein